VIAFVNGLFKIFQKAPAPTGAFWFLQFGYVTEKILVLSLSLPSDPSICCRAARPEPKVGEHYHPE
jgi:hypothetical protein